MKKLGSLLLALLFATTVFTSCVDAEANEIFDNIVPEKTNDGNQKGSHGTNGPG